LRCHTNALQTDLATEERSKRTKPFLPTTSLGIFIKVADEVLKILDEKHLLSPVELEAFGSSLLSAVSHQPQLREFIALCGPSLFVNVEGAFKQGFAGVVHQYFGRVFSSRCQCSHLCPELIFNHAKGLPGADNQALQRNTSITSKIKSILSPITKVLLGYSVIDCVKDSPLLNHLACMATYTSPTGCRPTTFCPVT